MGLESEYKQFLDFNDEVIQDLNYFKDSIEGLNLQHEGKNKGLEILEDFYNTLYNVKMSVQDPKRSVDKNRVIYDYKIILKTLKDERNKIREFKNFNEKIKRLQIKRLDKFFTNELDYNESDAKNIAIETLRKNTEKSERHLNWARKKGYLSRNSHYNAFKVEKELKEIFRFEEENGLEFAEHLKQKGFEYGEKELKNRPIIYMTENAMEKANQATRKAAIEGSVEETGGVFSMKRLGDRKILLDDFKNLETHDSKTSTTPKDEHFERMWGESGRELIWWHCHPRASDVDKGAKYADRLSDGDIRGLTDTLADGSQFGLMPGQKAGLREGITMLSTPWDHREFPKENIVWLACAVSSQGGASGFFNLHVVEDRKNLNVVDGRYSWTKIYNKWIKAAMAGASSVGPYSEFLEVKSLEEDLGIS